MEVETVDSESYDKRRDSYYNKKEDDNYDRREEYYDQGPSYYY